MVIWRRLPRHLPMKTWKPFVDGPIISLPAYVYLDTHFEHVLQKILVSFYEVITRVLWLSKIKTIILIFRFLPDL